MCPLHYVIFSELFALLMEREHSVYILHDLTHPLYRLVLRNRKYIETKENYTYKYMCMGDKS